MARHLGRTAETGSELGTLDKRLQKLWDYVDRNFRHAAADQREPHVAAVSA